MKKIILVVFLLALPLQTFALGLTPPSIKVNDVIKAGEKYRLEKFQVIGDETGTYSVNVEFSGEEYLNKNNFHSPKANWFKISPHKISLKKGETQIIDVVLQIPKGEKNVSGKKYFAFIVVSADSKKIKSDGSQVGVAVGQKIEFSVEGKVSFWKSVRIFVSDLFAGIGSFFASMFRF